MSSAEQSRMALLTFVTVSVATLFGVFLGAFIYGSFRGDAEEAPLAIGLIVIPIPAFAAALAFVFVARFETGRKFLGALSVFFGTLASTLVLVGIGLPGLVLAAIASGGFGVLARRLLDAPAAA